MHFAYPPRKASNPPPFKPRSSRIPVLRKGKIRTIALLGVAILFLLYLFSGGSRRNAKKTRHVPSGSPPVVMVTVLDSSHGLEYMDAIRENRIAYAKLHGYETFFAHVGDYDLHGSPMSWTKVVAMRHALNKFPDAQYLWFLHQDAFIMNPKVSVHKDIMAAEKLGEMMIRNQPVALPDSIIKTYQHLKPESIDLVVTQDSEGMSPESIIVRNSEWAEFFLDTWYDPLYRSYNFQKAETHALEHIVQWHPSVLSRLALIPQRTLNSYSREKLGVKYSEGDFVVRFAECTKTGDTSCQQEAGRLNELRRNAFANA